MKKRHQQRPQMNHPPLKLRMTKIKEDDDEEEEEE